MNSLGFLVVGLLALGCWVTLKETDGEGREGVTGLRLAFDKDQEEGGTLMLSSVRR
jgi:hypothetical protein